MNLIHSTERKPCEILHNLCYLPDITGIIKSRRNGCGMALHGKCIKHFGRKSSRDRLGELVVNMTFMLKSIFL